MPHPMHRSVVPIVEKAIDLMDRFMRGQVDLDDYAEQLRYLDTAGLLSAYKKDFMTDPDLVYYLDALMLLDSLQHQLDFQVAEYGANVALEDMKNLKELLHKFPEDS